MLILYIDWGPVRRIEYKKVTGVKVSLVRIGVPRAIDCHVHEHFLQVVDGTGKVLCFLRTDFFVAVDAEAANFTAVRNGQFGNFFEDDRI